MKKYFFKGFDKFIQRLDIIKKSKITKKKKITPLLPDQRSSSKGSNARNVTACTKEAFWGVWLNKANPPWGTAILWLNWNYQLHQIYLQF